MYPIGSTLAASFVNKSSVYILYPLPPLGAPQSQAIRNIRLLKFMIITINSGTYEIQRMFEGDRRVVIY